MTGFEGIGDFNSDDPWERYIAHQAAKGNYPPRTKYCKAKVAGTQGGFCRNEALPGKDYCEVHV